MPSRKVTRSIILGAAAIAVAGGSYGIVSATSSGSPAAASSSSSAASGGSSASSSRVGGRHGAGGGGSNARSGPAAGGAAGTVGSLSTSGFTITTSAGQKVTIKEASSTTYQKGTSAATVSAITTGEPVLVLGTTDSTTITATQVTVEPAGNAYTASSAQVIPFQQGSPTTSRQAGQIPADYTEGSGTIVSGTTANKATEAALAAYPGGVVDRVVKLSNGEYEVHNIGVNWPHHVFVNQDFKVVGAD
jgi:membrane-bound inhibitor of C-type lysozyme